MSMNHVDNMTTNVWNDIAFEVATDENGKFNQNLFDCTIEELKDEYINKLQKENELLRECVEFYTDHTHPDYNTRRARMTLEELEK